MANERPWVPLAAVIVMLPEVGAKKDFSDAFVATKVANCPRPIYYSSGHNISLSSRLEITFLQVKNRQP
jgi:hypothetical protein